MANVNYAECRVLIIIILNVIMLYVVMLNVIILIVVAPKNTLGLVLLKAEIFVTFT
jgi:hypothetical protein